MKQIYDPIPMSIPREKRPMIIFGVLFSWTMALAISASEDPLWIPAEALPILILYFVWEYYREGENKKS